MDLSPDEDNFPGRLLHQAALWDNVELLQELLLSGYEVDARDGCGRTALHAAALGERSRCLPALCSAGADVNARSDDHTGGGKTALHIAAERGHLVNLETLLASGATLWTQDAGGNSALALAERAGHHQASRLLTMAADAVEKERLQRHAALRESVCRGDVQQVKARLAALGDEAELVVNLAPGGANTLLYVAAEAGQTDAVIALLAGGADGRAHPVTHYSPLYVASYHGHADIARTLLVHLPRAAQQETVEKWLPIHAACIGGHGNLVSLLLEYPYPEDVLNTYTDPSGQWQYRAAFYVNACDVSGQTALYVACTLGNWNIVDILLRHAVPCTKLVTENEQEVRGPPPKKQDVLSPSRSGISLGIHAIVSKLTGQTSTKNESCDVDRRVRPVDVEAGRPGDSCLGAAVRGSHFRVAQRLLAAGADPDAPCRPPDKVPSSAETEYESRRRQRSSSALPGRTSASPSPCRTSYNDREGPWTPLAIAARAKNSQLVQLLLSHGATDAHCHALRECARNGLEPMLATLLATKAYPDPDYKINKNGVAETVFNGRDGDSTLTYNALSPSTPVMVNWTELHCHLAKIRMKWIREAALRVNPKLGKATGALHAVTRLDISNNELRVLPPELFTLVSLRYLNAAQNKLERLPLPSDPFEEEEERGSQRTRRKSSRRSNSRFRVEVYSAPVLEELYLQDNRLEELPPGLFSLTALTTLDVSNNKLRILPPEVWAAPRLRDLNAALNHLRELPLREQAAASSSQPLSPSEPSPQLSASPSVGHASPFSFSLSKSESRSPSIDRSVEDALAEDSDEDGVAVMGNRAGNAVWSEARRPHTWRRALDASEPLPRDPPSGSPLTSLNLSHNQFTCVPPSLACLAPRLTRLNMAYNSLRSMSYVTSYPTSLRQLDLSHNEITCWPSLPQVENLGTSEGDPLACHCLVPSGGQPARSRPRSGGSVRSQLLSAACPARRHLRLEGLRTLILANNLLTRIQLTTDDDGYSSASVSHDGGLGEDDEWEGGSNIKARLLFPLLSMLDVSCNLLRVIPPAIHELSNLSVLNISGNKDITDLPPQMGLLSRLWNLNTSGCPLQEPLRSMVQCGKYKSMDIVGFLKSVLEEAQPYTRMKLMFVGLQGIGKTSLLECLRQESAAAHRRKPTDHWAKRMGNKAGRNRNMSTVGVDIGAWVYEKQRSTKGPVTFRTWDFGGQQEYYATHQYFLSRRSLYLVLWKVTDGKRGLAGALQWLRSIQARAPGSPAILVATHYDQVGNSNLPENECPEALQTLIRSAIMGATDADKLGLPRILDSVEVSCSTRHNIRLLADIIYSVAFSVKPPGSKEPLLEQRVPATYLALEECVAHIAPELKEPVLRHDEYKKLVTQYMQQRNHRSFRDAAELHQATMFLHENGVLLHYDDATLKELYFLRPQWLCDMLAHVVTVREINPFASNGIMKLDDLAHVFKASPLLGRGEEARSLAVSLLNKFELALGWDGRALLVPPLLPTRESNAQLPLRARTWGNASRSTPRRAWVPPNLSALPPEQGNAGTDSPKLVSDTCSGISVTARSGARALRRLLLLSYVPCGFWPRLCARVLADDSVADCAPPFYRAPHEIEIDEATTKALDLNWSWKLWRTGLKLVCGDLVMLVVREVPSRYDQLLGSSLPLGDDEELVDGDGYHNLRFRLRQDGVWCDLDAQTSTCVEILLPAQVCVVKREDCLPIGGYQSISLEPNPEALARLLALISDHVDLLLEDWYPSLGTRFVHTSSGRCLITRIVPCPTCLREPGPPPHQPDHGGLMQAFKRLEMNGGEGLRRVRLSQESRASDGDSGVGAESNASSRIGSVEGALIARPVVEEAEAMPIAYGWTVEECILAACSNGDLQCPMHGELRLADLAPDTLLLDVEEDKRARWEHVTRGRLLGRGAFGVVLRAEWRHAGRVDSVALKVLQPVSPGPQAGASARHAYKAAMSRWEREPAAAACRAYCGLRQELSVLSALRHQHVVPLRAVCASPLALLLTLAPMGALDSTLREYRGCGVRIGVRAARALALQAARALEYLHTKRIVYRDLKAENVLVWSMPKPHEASAAESNPAAINVHVKLGDYGISRLAPPSGTKGFGGTEGFMAPEIMRYNGEEEYNEKVDCFSYGMLLYEILSLRQPFEGHEAVKEAVLDGCRPTLSPKELQYPCCMLELMRRCWSTAPEHRPCSSALVSLTAAPEFTALQDACSARTAACASALPIATLTDEGSGGWEVWCGGEGERVHTLLATPTAFTHQHSLKIPPDNGNPVHATAICRVGARVWVGDSVGRVSVYSAATCAHLWGCAVQDTVGGGPKAAVAALQPLTSLARVALALDSGRLFLVTVQRPAAEGSFVLSELGAASELCCLAAVPRPHGYVIATHCLLEMRTPGAYSTTLIQRLNSAKIWAGGAGLYAYAVNAAGVCGADELCAGAGGRVSLLASAHDEPYVFTHSQPGCVVQQWSVRTREVTARLDCSKLVPCSESLQSIAIDEHHPDNCQVRALCAHRSQLYAGTAWGCVIVADAATLRPITVFRPYDNEVRAIIPLVPHEAAGGGAGRLATLGHGYRPLLHRYAPAQANSNQTNTYSGMYCLLWRPDHWLPD